MGAFQVYQTLLWWSLLSVPKLPLKMLKSCALQDGRLMLRLASDWALQDVWVMLTWCLSGWPIRPISILGCLTL